MSNTVKIADVQLAAVKPALAVKDAGRVKVGSGMIRYASPAPAKLTDDKGRVKVGSGMMRF